VRERLVVFASAWQRWLLAGVAYLAATGLNFSFAAVFAARLPLLPYFPALIATGYFTGTATSTVLLLLSAATVARFWVAPLANCRMPS
jgi:hypothetical protein